jgi:cysteinyl-tRNA synthetase
MDKLIENDEETKCCVFYFFHENELQFKKKKMHKIIKTNFFTQNELTIHQKIFKIPNTNIIIVGCTLWTKLDMNPFMLPQFNDFHRSGQTT